MVICDKASTLRLIKLSSNANKRKKITTNILSSNFAAFRHYSVWLQGQQGTFPPPRKSKDQKLSFQKNPVLHSNLFFSLLCQRNTDRDDMQQWSLGLTLTPQLNSTIKSTGCPR